MPLAGGGLELLRACGTESECVLAAEGVLAMGGDSSGSCIRGYGEGTRAPGRQGARARQSWLNAREAPMLLSRRHDARISVSLRADPGSSAPARAGAQA